MPWQPQGRQTAAMFMQPYMAPNMYPTYQRPELAPHHPDMGPTPRAFNPSAYQQHDMNPPNVPLQHVPQPPPWMYSYPGVQHDAMGPNMDAYQPPPALGGLYRQGLSPSPVSRAQMSRC